MRPALLLAFVLSLAHPLPTPAQQSDPAQILQSIQQQSEKYSAEWLASPDPRLRAWGAYAVLRDQNKSSLPALLAQIAAYHANPVPFAVPAHDAAQDAMVAILDAAIQLDAQVPVPDAANLYPEFPAQSLILLSRSREDVSKSLLQIFQSRPIDLGAWLAAGNLLTDRRSPGFAAVLLNGFTVHALVSVVVPGAQPKGGGIAGSRAGSLPWSKPDWPAVGQYYLSGCSAHPQQGAVVLAAGMDTAYYIREVDQSYSQEAGRYDCAWYEGTQPGLDAFREHMLDGLVFADRAAPPIKSFVSLTIEWSGPRTYRARLNDLIAQQEEVFARAVRRLRDHNLLSADESPSGPMLQIQIWDQRPKRSPPLPAITSLPPNVAVSLIP